MTKSEVHTKWLSSPWGGPKRDLMWPNLKSTENAYLHYWGLHNIGLWNKYMQNLLVKWYGLVDAIIFFIFCPGGSPCPGGWTENPDDDRYCYYINPSLGVTQSEAAGWCVDHGIGASLGSIAVSVCWIEIRRFLHQAFRTHSSLS